jgi:hypothetical protein
VQKLADLRSFSEPEQEPLPKDIKALELLQTVYRGEYKATPQQMRAAIESLPYESPKLPARVQVTTDFGYRLDRAIEASNRAKLIEGHAIRDE